MTIAIASSLVLLATIIPLIYHIDAYINNGLTLVSFLASLLIIAFSLVQYSTNDAARAEQFHRCALEINELCRVMEIHFDTLGESETEDCANRYNTILQKFSINHNKIDFDYYKTTKPDQSKMDAWSRIQVHTQRLFILALPFILLAFLPAAFLLLIVTDPSNSTNSNEAAKMFQNAK